jgi:ABC-type Fe3+ transport system permease subunit
MKSEQAGSSARSVVLAAVWLVLALAIGSLFSVTERAALWATISLGGVAGLLSVGMGTLLAGAIYQLGPRARWAVFALIFASLLPVYWHLAAWDSLFGRLGWWAAFGGSPLQLALPQWLAAVWVHAISGVAPAAAIILLFLFNSGRAAEEQALIDASPIAVFFQVTLPRIWPALIFASGWCFLATSREIAVTDIYRIGTVAEQVYLGFALGQFDQLLSLWPEGEQALSLRLYLFTVLLMAGLAGIWIARIPSWSWSGEFRHWRDSATGISWPARAIAGIVLGLMLLVPLFSLLFRAGVRVRQVNGVAQAGWAAQDLLTSLSQSLRESRDEFGWSLAIALLSANLLLAVAVGGAALAERSRAGRFIFLGSIALLFGMPGPICGLLVGRAWNLLEFEWAWWLADRTILLPVLASCLFCWPLAALLVYLVLRTMPRELNEAAATQGATEWQAFSGIQLMANRTSLLGVWGVLLIVVFGDLSAQQMVAAPGIDTIPRQLLGWMHAGVDELAAATSILVAALVSLLLVALLWCCRWRW